MEKSERQTEFVEISFSFRISLLFHLPYGTYVLPQHIVDGLLARKLI